MELSFAKCESIMNTLPIGFYTGRRINVKIDKKVKTSYYDPMEDSIVVSYPIIAHRMKVMPEGSCDEEEAVRSMMYHEVSHAILTPAEALQNSFAVNCMEDERIETVLRNYFHGVNFRKQLLDVHGGHIPKATDTQSAFFNAVRFGLGTSRVQKEVQRIISKYAPMNRATARWERNIGAGYYEDDIEDLYRLIQKDFKTNPEEFQPQDGQGGEAQMMDKMVQVQKDGDGEDSDKKGSSQKGDSDEAEKCQCDVLHESGLSEEQVKSSCNCP